MKAFLSFILFLAISTYFSCSDKTTNSTLENDSARIHQAQDFGKVSTIRNCEVTY